jgi:small subunit ribosomal protein S1
MPNPWDKYEGEFGVGTTHDIEITETVDKGAVVNFNEDISVFIPTRHLEKEDGSKLKKGEKAQIQIIEFNKEFKRVVGSHMILHKEEEAKNVQQAAAKAQEDAKPTIGDANSKLQALKDRMEGK